MNKIRKEKIERRKALEEWSKAVKLRDGNICQICKGIKLLNSHHIIPKEFSETRLDVANGITLCVKCHKFGKFSAHKNGLYFINWLRTNKKEQYDYLLTKLAEINRN